MVKYGKLTAAEWVKRAVPTTALGTHGTILYGVAAMQGWRDAQEDAHEMGVCADGSAFFFGVYDGHGGPAVAAFAAQQLRGEFEKRVQHGASTAAALEAAYVACDARLSAGEVDGADAAGSTALTVVVTASEIVCACAGDSVGVFCRGGRRRATPLGAAHTPREAGEAARIGAAGGLVLRGRVNGSLAVSRALGDVSFKRNSAKPPAEQAVVAVPDVQTFAREAADEFFVVACDGVWDVFTLEQVATFVETAWRAQVREPSQIAKRLIEFALLRGSKDNLTALVVILNADRLTQRLGQRRDTLTRVSRSADSRGEAASRGGSARNTPSAKHSHKLAICVDNSLFAPSTGSPLETDAPVFDRIPSSGVFVRLPAADALALPPITSAAAPAAARQPRKPERAARPEQARSRRAPEDAAVPACARREAPAPAAEAAAAPGSFSTWRESDARRAQTPQRPELSPAALHAHHAIVYLSKPLSHAAVAALDTDGLVGLLAALGLGDYSQRFRDRAITGEQLTTMRRAQLQDELDLGEADAIYLAGAVYNLWMNLRWRTKA